MTGPSLPDDEVFFRGQTLRRHGRLAATLPVVALTMAAGLFVVLWSQTPQPLVAVWFAVAAAGILSHQLVHHLIQRRTGSDPFSARSLQLYRLGVLMHGVAWGLAGLLLFLIPEGLLHQAVLLTVLGVVAAAMVIGSFDLKAVAAFCVPAALPSTLHYLAHEASPLDLAAMAAGAAAAVVAALRNRHNFLQSVQLRRAEQEQARQRAAALDRVRQAIALAGVSGWEYDPLTQIVVFDENTRTAMRMGRGGPEPLKQLLARLMPDSAVSLERALQHSCLTGEALSTEVVAKPWPDATLPRVVLLSGGAVMEQGRVVRLTGTMQDMTALRAREKEAADQARLLQQLVQNTNQGMWFLDDAGLTSDVNDAMCRLLGRSRQEVLGRPVFDFFFDEDLAVLHHQLELRKRGHKEGYEIGINRPDGTRVQCFNNATPLYDTAGHKVGSVGMWTDLTPLKNALAAAEAASRAKSEFLSQVSHELRTPLNAILGFAQLLQTDRQHPLAPTQQIKVQEMLSGASHLLDLINGLLDLGRIESGQFSVALQAIAVQPLLQESLKLVAPVAQGRGIRMQLEDGLTPGLAVSADATRLTQILVNLLGNAIKYNRPEGEVRMRALACGDRVHIEVQDTGLGLTEQEQQRLFEPFQRLRAEGSGVEGTGIGLALSRRLAQAMSGGLSVRSTPGEGSTFTIDIARAPDRVPESAQALPGSGAQETDASAGAPLHATVLYIEDNPVNAMVMEAMVGRIEGLRMLHAEDGLPGLQMAIDQGPDLILTDIQMPGMDGFTLLGHLRENETTRGIPVVAITADATANSLERGREAGFSDYLTKPVQMDALHAVLRRLLSPADTAASVKNGP